MIPARFFVLVIVTAFSATLLSQNVSPLRLKERIELGVKPDILKQEITTASSLNLFFHSAGTIYDTSANCDIDTYSRITITNSNITEVSDSTFTITKDGVNRELAISDLRKLSFINHGFWKGFAYGTLGTAVLTGLLMITASGHSGGEGGSDIGYVLYAGLIVVIPVGIITGLITEFTSTDEDFYFKNVNDKTKVNRLKYIVLKHRN